MQTVRSISRKESLDQQFFIFQPLKLNIRDHSLNMMIIDDSKKDIELFKDLLSNDSSLNFTLTSWLNAHEAIIALEYGQIFPPDIVILDLVMPSINGKMVLGRLKEISKVKNIPVIIHSSLNNYENAKDVQSLDAHAFFAKPLNTSVFASYILDKEI